MKDYLSEVNAQFPARRNREQKATFVDYVKAEIGEQRVKVETLGKNSNVIIGDVSRAKAVITAHYDTPASSPIPNMMIPANKIKGTLIHLPFPLGMAMFSILAAFGISAIFSLASSATLLIYLVLYLALFFSTTRLITNKNNKNDNTSGVATVLTLAASYDGDEAAFILFDNEEKGLLGSKAFNKKHSALMKDKLLINLDCVGNGDNMILIPKKTAEATEEYSLMREAFGPTDDRFGVHYVPFKKALGNSDHKSFPCSVGIMAASRGKLVRFITGRIHTPRDTVANPENIAFLHKRLYDFIAKL